MINAWMTACSLLNCKWCGTTVQLVNTQSFVWYYEEYRGNPHSKSSESWLKFGPGNSETRQEFCNTFFALSTNVINTINLSRYASVGSECTLFSTSYVFRQTLNEDASLLMRGGARLEDINTHRRIEAWDRYLRRSHPLDSGRGIANNPVMASSSSFSYSSSS